MRRIEEELPSPRPNPRRHDHRRDCGEQKPWVGLPDDAGEAAPGKTPAGGTDQKAADEHTEQSPPARRANGRQHLKRLPDFASGSDNPAVVTSPPPPPTHEH